jgi:vacuolar-type H+-ATPase subunit H
MKPIIKEVFESEEKAGGILRQAQNQAAEIRQAAERDVSESLSQAKEQARQIIHTTVEEAKKQADQVCQEKLQDAEQDRETLPGPGQDRDAAGLDALIETLCHVVQTTEHETDRR